jgi:ABC-type spermidine/putrescine transport system permease subunit II
LWDDPVYDEADEYFRGQAKGRLYIEQIPEVPARNASPYSQIAILRVADAATKLHRWAQENGVMEASALEAEAMRVLERAEESGAPAMERNLFLDRDEEPDPAVAPSGRAGEPRPGGPCWEAVGVSLPRRVLSERSAGWVLMGPFLLITLVFVVFPLYRSIVLAFSQTFGPGATTWAGMLNFVEVLRDPLFWVAVRNTALFTLGSLFIQLPCSLLLASVLNRPGLKGRAVYRLIMFMPQLVGLVFAAMIGGVFFAKTVGPVNTVLNELFGVPLDFPGSIIHVIPSLIVIAMWLYVGFNMVYFLAALQTVDRSLVEAAMIDGASPPQRFCACGDPVDPTCADLRRAAVVHREHAALRVAVHHAQRAWARRTGG